MAAQGERLRLIEKIGYGAGDFASNLYLGFFGMFLLYYYTDIVGLNPAIVGTMFLLSRVFDAVTDPMMGMIADRTRSRWGRYRPYLLWVTLPFGILGPLTMVSPPGSETVKIAYAALSYGLVMLAYTAINVPYSALLGVISPSSDERNKATVFRFAGATSGGLVVGALTATLVARLGQGDEAEGIFWAMVVFAAFAVVSFLFCFATTKERVEARPQPLAIRQDLRSMLTMKPWLILAAASILVLNYITARFSTAIFYFKYAVDGDAMESLFFENSTALFLTSASVFEVSGALLAGWMMKRMTKKRLFIIAAIVQAICLPMFLLLPGHSVWPIIALQLPCSLGFSAQVVVIFAMYTDCAEYAEWKTGRQMTGLVIAASLFALKFGGALGGAVPGYLMAATGFVPNQPQTAEAIWGIQAAFSLFPALCIALALLLMTQYELFGPTLRKVEAELAERRAARSSNERIPA